MDTNVICEAKTEKVTNELYRRTVFASSWSKGPQKERVCSFMIKILLIHFICNHNLEFHDIHCFASWFFHLWVHLLTIQFSFAYFWIGHRWGGTTSVPLSSCSTSMRYINGVAMSIYLLGLLFLLYDSTSTYLSILLFMNTWDVLKSNGKKPSDEDVSKLRLLQCFYEQPCSYVMFHMPKSFSEVHILGMVMWILQIYHLITDSF